MNDFTEELQKCYKCGESKLLINFSLNKNRKNGHMSLCKKCQSDYAKQYYINHSEQLKKYSRDFRLENLESYRERARQWKLDHPERTKELRRKHYIEKNEEEKENNKEWLKNHPGKTKEYSKRRYTKYSKQINEQKRKDYIKNKDKIREQQKLYCLNHREQRKAYMIKNSEKIKARQKECRVKNYKKYQEVNRKWRERNPDKVREIRRNIQRRYRATIMGKLNHNITCYIEKSLNGTKNGRHRETLVDFTAIQLKEHLEKLFKPGMTWKNYGKNGWHIDHIRPKSSFDYKTPEDLEFKLCWSLNNLQPLWALENSIKGAKILTKEEMAA